MKLLEQINTMERLDQLIRLGATGNLRTLSLRLELSVSTVKRQLETMRALGAPVIYNFTKQSYEYEYHVNFVYGFHEIDCEGLRRVGGGYSNLRKSLRFFELALC